LRSRGALKRAVLAAVLCATPSLAAAPKPPRGPRSYRIGPVAVSPSLRFAAGVDTNVFNQPVAPVADTGLVFTPDATARWPLSRRLRVEGTGGLAFNYYRREGSERFVDRFGEVRAEADLRRWTVFARAGGGQYRERFSIEVDERVLRQEGRVGAGLRGQPTRRLGVSLELFAESYRFGPSPGGTSETIRDALDRNSTTTRLKVDWRLTHRTRGTASVDEISDRFRVPRTSGARDVPSIRVLAGVETTARTLVTGRALAGFRRFPGLGAAGDGATVPVLAVALSAPVFEIARIGLTADRDVFYSAGVGVPGRLSQDNAYAYGVYRVEVQTQLPPDLIVRAYAGVDRSRYLLPTIPGGAGTRSDERWVVGGSVLRRLTAATRAGAFAEHAIRRSVVPGFSYEGWRYGLEIRVVP
jgi:hypothetical protein